MKKNLLALSVLTAALAGCGGGDVNISPSTVDNSVDNSTNGGGSGTANPCASYSVGGQTRQGTLSGDNCEYGSSFVDFDNPLTTDVTFADLGDGAHIFQGSLFVGENYDSDAELAAAGISKGGDGPTITVAAGATLAFQTSSDFMVINRGSQIQAVGSPSKPITFTSVSDIEGTVGPEDVSQWGGMVINGFGVTNKCDYTGSLDNGTLALAQGEECHIPSEGSEGDAANNYGGDNNNDDSGTLKYVVVKHTGAQVANGDELNGITFGAVGAGTTVDYLETYSVYDDGIEFFGGAVDVSHYVALYVNDDSIDIDEGYRGTVEYALVIQSETNGNRCVESDGIGSYVANSPVNADFISRGLNSQATLKNITCIVSPVETADAGGTGTHDPGQGLRIREAHFPYIANMVVTTAFQQDGKLGDDDYNYCVRIDDEGGAAALAGDLTFTSSVIACQDLVDGDLDGQSTLAWLQSNGNATYQSDELGDDPTAASNSNLVILDGFYALPVADMVVGGVNPNITPEGGASYIGGVVANDDWTQGWTYGLHAGNRAQPLWFE
jgi:hypothetical protein